MQLDILAMLDSPLFRMVIPYHASGMLPMFAKLVGVDMYNDYTDYQNTTVRQYYDVNGKQNRRIKPMSEEKKFPTESMLKAREEWAKKTPEEKAASENAVREELKRYYEKRFSARTRRELLGEEE